MNIKVTLIRHGKTQGNIDRKYVGQTEEPLSEFGIDELKSYVAQNFYPKADLLFSSPLKRCLQTSNIIYSNEKPIICNEIMECNFGDFQGKGYIELQDNEIYKTWLENHDEIIFPNGESSTTFKKRCKEAFEYIILETVKAKKTNLSIVCHGGTIRSILEGYTDKSFYNWIVDNGNGFIFDFDTHLKKVTTIKPLWSKK